MKNITGVIYNFWIDHLEIYWSFKDEKFIDSKLVKIIAWYEVERSFKIPRYQYKITFKKDDLPIMAFHKWYSDQQIPTKDYFLIYSTGFRLLDELEIQRLFLYFHLWSIRRFDIAVDFVLPIEDVLDTFWELKQKGATFNGANGEVQTRYIWEKQNSKNRRQLIRIYDKQADIRAKGKSKVFADYMLKPYITRIELEVRRELSKNIDYTQLFNSEVLFWIMKNYLQKHTQILDSIDCENITLYQKEYKKLQLDEFQSIYYKDQRRKIFLWHWKWVYELWFCPVRALILEWYIQDGTKIILWVETIEKLLEKERVAKENAKESKYIRENWWKILDNLYKYGKV